MLEDLLDALVGARLLRGPARIVDAKVPIIKCCLALGEQAFSSIRLPSLCTGNIEF